MAIFIRNENYVNFDLFWPDQVVNLFIPDFLNFLNINKITKGVWGNQSYKGCGSKSVYFQRIASTWKYTNLFPHPLCHNSLNVSVCIQIYKMVFSKPYSPLYMESFLHSRLHSFNWFKNIMSSFFYLEGFDSWQEAYWVQQTCIWWRSKRLQTSLAECYQTANYTW